MKKIYCLFAMLVAFAVSGFAQDYKTNYSESDKSGHASRYPSQVIVKSAEYGDQTIAWASGAGHSLFKDATDTEVKVAPGEDMQVLVSYTGNWMSAYVYIDLGNDKQFGSDVDETNHKALEGSDLVSWSFYSFNPEGSEDPGWNSLGTSITGGARSTVNCPAFKAPSAEGTYRVRVKIDWNSIDPAGSMSGHLGGAMGANGGGIMDFMLKVEAAKVETFAMKFHQTAGTWTKSNAAGTYASEYTTTATDPFMTVSCGQNNMAWNAAGDPILYTGTVTKRETPYTIAVQDGYEITDVKFNTEMLAGQWTSVTLDGCDEVVTPTTGLGTVERHGMSKNTVQFILKTNADNKGVTLSNFEVTVVKTKEIGKQTIFIYDKTSEHNVTYRIPSIASIPAGEHKGRIVALTDYRPGGADVGMGEVDIHAKYSDDFGKTWSSEIVVVDGQWGSSKGARWYSFGDPVSIADRESGKLMVVSCSGNIAYTSGSRSNHQGVEVYYSEDGGATWSEPVDVSEQIYSQLDAVGIKSLFVGSGGFTQSKFVKKGSHYRVYGGILCNTNAGGGRNYAIYTDDLGATWNILGGSSAQSITSGGDEAKVEELPNGDVLHSSRVNGGRIFNIWRWDDSSRETGAWDGQVGSNSGNNGVVASGNSCNGEILIVPAKRVADDKCVYLAMQSIPFGGGRANVGIYWKEIESLASMSSTKDFAANWTKGYQASIMGSAYSAMVLQEDGNIGFLVEEETYGFGYSQVYHSLSYEKITDGRYTFKSDKDSDFDRSAFDVKSGTVSYNLNWNGVLKSTVSAKGYYGEMLPTPATPDFTVASVPAVVLSDATVGKTFEVECSWSADAPMEIADQAKDATYYYMRIKDADNLYICNSGTSQIGLGTEAAKKQTGNGDAMWGFVGNPFDGFQIVNYNGGFLASTDPSGDGNTGGKTYPHVVTDLASDECGTWMLKQSSYYEGGFFAFSKDWNVAMNYRSPYLAYWTGGYDAGSTLRVELVPDSELPVPTGVETIAPAVQTSSAVYNVAGQRVALPSKGLYIVNGKKVMTK